MLGGVEWNGVRAGVAVGGGVGAGGVVGSGVQRFKMDPHDAVGVAVATGVGVGVSGGMLCAAASGARATPIRKANEISASARRAPATIRHRV